MKPALSIITAALIVACSPLAAVWGDGFSSPAIHGHLEKATLAPGQIYKKDFTQITIRKEIRNLAERGGINFVFLYPPPGFPVMTRFVPTIPGDETEKIGRLALEARYEVAMAANTLCLFPEGRHETSAILSGAISWNRLLIAAEELRFRSLDLPTLGNEKPPGVEKTEVADGKVTVTCTRVPLTWFVPFLASGTGRKVRLDRPLRGHVDCRLEKVDAEEALFIALALAGRVTMKRHDRYEALEATHPRLAGINPHASLGHPALGWLSVAAESLGSKDRLTPRTATRIDEALEKMRSGDFNEALKIARSLLSARKDLWEARFISGIAKASLGDYDGALGDLDKISRIRGRDPIVDEVVREIGILKTFPFVKGSATFFR